MDSITTLGEAAEFVNQFVDIHDFTYLDVTATPCLLAAGFTKVGRRWSTDGKDYPDVDIPEGAIIYDPKGGKYIYSINGIVVHTTSGYGKYTSTYNVGGLFISVGCYASELMPPTYTNIRITDDENHTCVHAGTGNTTVGMLFVDSDDAVLQVELYYDNSGTLGGSRYADSIGRPHCKSRPARTSGKKEIYYLRGCRMSKSDWEVNRMIPNWQPPERDP